MLGAGKVGQTLAQLLNQHGAVAITDVVTRSPESAEAATAFIGNGRPLTDISHLSPADLFMLACPDDQISAVATSLAISGIVKTGNIIFHCSGAKSSELLSSLRQSSGGHPDIYIASLHPLKSFASPVNAIQSFAGTYCGIEGDAEAHNLLNDLMLSIGGIPFKLDTHSKTLYHAASVIACNYLVTLQEISLQTFAEAGVERQLATNILEPLVRGTVNNIFNSGTANALTGPVARGDSETVREQLQALHQWRPESGEIYRMLGHVALELSNQQGSASSEQLEKTRLALKPRSFKINNSGKE